MLSENTRVRAKIQSAFEQLAMPHVAKVRCGYDIIDISCINIANILHFIYLV